MKINKKSGLSLQIYFPNTKRLMPFELEFFINPTASKDKNLIIKYDGVKAENCTVCASGVYVYQKNPFPLGGVLKYRATYNCPSIESPTGFQEIFIDDIDTNIELVASGGEHFDPVENAATLVEPDINNFERRRIPLVMPIYPVGPQGARGFNGDAIDYAISGEQICQNEFWATSSAERKQVYCQTFKGTMPTQITALETVIFKGTFSQMSIVTGSIGGFPHGWHILEDSYYWTLRSTPDSLRIGVPNTSNTNLHGQPYVFTLKYTK